MARVLAILVFALAAGSAALAATGLVVPPHVDPPGTPRVHEHVFATYRYAVYLLRLERPVLGGEHIQAAPSPSAALDVLVLASLALLVARLPRPNRRLIARLGVRRPAGSQWGGVPALGPPRRVTLTAA